MRGGHVFEPTRRWVPAIAGTAGSVLPTPQAWDANRGPDNSRLRGDGLRPSGQQGTLNLAGAISLLPTPQAWDHKSFGPNVDWKKRAEKHADSVASVLMNLPSDDGSSGLDG